MRNADFYDVAAQVLPTLLIAVLLELRVLVPRVVRAGNNDPQGTFQPFGLVSWEAVGTGSVVAYVAITITFIVGEFTALLVIFSGTGGWLPVLAGPASLIALFILIVVAVTAPFIGMWTAVITDNADSEADD